jgi:large subunit ribosomal protein L16
MLQPKRVKYRKTHKGHRRGKAQSGNTVVFGDFALQAMAAAWISSQQIEAARRAITRYVRRGGKVWIRIFRLPRRQQRPEWAAARVRLTTGLQW